MKPTQVTELLANIKATVVSFFSIMMFVALGVGVFAGIYWVSPALRLAADEAYDEGALHDAQVQFPYGLTEDDLAQLRAVEGVADVEEGRLTFVVLKRDDAVSTVKVQQIGNRINVPRVVEGALPDGANELALKATSAANLGVGVGDTLTFVHDAEDGLDGKTDEDGMAQLTTDTFTVTGLVESSEYLAVSTQGLGHSPKGTGAVDAVAWAPAEAFDASAYQDGYPLVNVRYDGVRGLGTFTAEYKQAAAVVDARVEELGETLAPARYDSLHDQAQQKLDEGEAQLEDAKAKIDEGEKQITGGEEKLAQGRDELDALVAEAEAKLAEAYETLQAGEAEKAKGAEQIEAAEAKLQEAQGMIDALDELKAMALGVAEDMLNYLENQDKALAAKEITQQKHDENLDKNGAAQQKKLEPLAQRVGKPVPTIDHTTYKDAQKAIRELIDLVEDVTIEYDGKSMTVAQARQELAAGWAKLEEGKAEFAQKSAQLEAGWMQYHAGLEELEAKKAEGEQKLAEGQTQLEDAKVQISDAKQQVADKEPQLEAAKEKVASLKRYEWSVLGRAYNGGAIEVTTLSNVSSRLSFSMAALFVIVGLLVSYSAVGRIVREQITQIGTKKALGLRNREITASFMLYTALAVVLGSIIGLVVGVFVVEAIIARALAARFTLAPLPPYFDIKLAILAVAIELVLVLGAAWLSCRTILKRHAVELLRGEKPPSGKSRFYEAWGIWQKLPLYTQTIVNNCMNDKRRVFSTIVGVAGCTALVVTAITLNNDVLNSYNVHYDRVYGFDSIAYVDDGVDGGADAVSQALEAEGCDAAVVMQRAQGLKLPDGTDSVARIVVPADEASFERLYHVNPVQGGDVDLSANGVWVTRAYAEHMGAKAGDQVEVTTADGSVVDLPILGFYEFYLTYNEMVMGRDAYEQAFDAAFTPNAVLCNAGQVSLDDLRAKLAGVEGFGQIVDDKSGQYTVFASFSSVSRAVVLIYLALAVLMATVVLLNLNVMFIDEKKRELIVLMINGFSVKQAKRYIYNDTVFLTALGIILGLALGTVAGLISVWSMEPATASFYKVLDWPALGIATAVSIVLSTVMSAIALRRIPAFKLTDINRI